MVMASLARLAGIGEVLALNGLVKTVQRRP